MLGEPDYERTFYGLPLEVRKEYGGAVRQALEDGNVETLKALEESLCVSYPNMAAKNCTFEKPEETEKREQGAGFIRERTKGKKKDPNRYIQIDPDRAISLPVMQGPVTPLFKALRGISTKSF